MTANERLRKLRKDIFCMNMEDFGKILGISKSGVSEIESGRRNVTEQHIRLLISNPINGKCINPDWLRDEQGPVLLERSRSQQIEEFIRDILTNEPEGQKVRLISALASLDDKGWDMMYNLALKMVGKAPDEIEREKMHADLDRQLDEEKEAMGGSGASQAM